MSVKPKLNKISVLLLHCTLIDNEINLYVWGNSKHNQLLLPEFYKTT